MPMKRIWILFLFVFFLTFLSSCSEVITYDDLDQEYQAYVSSQEDVYTSYIDYFNHLSTNTIQSVVQVRKNVIPSLSSGTGSGVIFHADSIYYYVLTNHHVVYSVSTNVSYQVLDYKGNLFNATLYATDSAYDLAILRFRKFSNVFPVAGLASINPEVDHRIAVLGYPNFQVNAIVIGQTDGYQRVNIESNGSSVEINVDFDVLVTTASVKSGSSGSPVFDQNFHVVGIIYAGNFATNSNLSVYSFVIPIEKVREFLIAQGFQLGGA
jgi:S1-C subfamily serine protease